MKSVQYKVAPSVFVPLPFITGHDPFEQMAATAAAAEHFRCRQGRGGTRRTILPSSLLWICENGRVGGKSKTVL